jgi:hypothetical protein
MTRKKGTDGDAGNNDNKSREGESWYVGMHRIGRDDPLATGSGVS